MIGSSISLYHNCGHSPAWPLVPRAVIELEEQGFGFSPHVAPVWNDPCLVAGIGSEIAGFLVYRYDEVKCSWFILLAWVAPAHRRRGIHSDLFNALVGRAQKRDDILSIDCGTHIDNVAAQAAFEAQGRVRTAIMYSFPLRHSVEGKDPSEIG